MLKNTIYLVVACFALVGCGNGNNNDAPTYGGGAYNDYNGLGRQCPAQVANDWNQLIASRCNNVPNNFGPQARACAQGARQFADRYPGINCDFAVQDQSIEWCPGNDWRNQQSFTINDQIIQGIFNQYGGAASMNQGYGPGNGPGYSPGDGRYQGQRPYDPRRNGPPRNRR